MDHDRLYEQDMSSAVIGNHIISEQLKILYIISLHAAIVFGHVGFFTYVYG